MEKKTSSIGEHLRRTTVSYISVSVPMDRNVMKREPEDAPRFRSALVRAYGVFSLLAAIAMAAWGEATPPQSNVVVSSQSIWSLVGINGEVREIWGGPEDTNGAPAGEPKDVLKTSGYGQIRSDGRWTDLRDLSYSHAGSRPGRLALASRDGKVHIFFTTRRSSAESPVFIRYVFSSPVDFRFRLELTANPEATRSEAPASSGSSSLQIHKSLQLNLATNPPGEEILENESRSLVREVKQATEIIVCLYLEDGVFSSSRDETAVQSWIRRGGGTEDSDAERMQHRLTINTGLADFDRLLEYSVDAVESARFRSGALIAGRDGWYKNTWIRDGTYSTIGTDLFGLHAQGDAFYRYWIGNGGYSWGGENEAQQPAIAILGIWFHSRLIEDDEAFLNASFAYVTRFADYYTQRTLREGMINTAEEWICQVPTKTAWPNAEIYAGLRAAAKIATRLGHSTESTQWNAAAQALQAAILATAYDESRQRFIPLAGPAGGFYRDQQDPANTETSGPMRDERVDSGMLMLARLEVLGRGLGAVAVDDPRFAATQAWIHKVLEQSDHSISRFEGNPASSHYPQGEWPVWPLTSSVASDVELLRGRTDRAWRYLLSGLVRKRGYDADATVYALPEQWRFNGDAVSTRQLTWSHGEFLASSVLLLTGLQVDVANADLALAPSLPPGAVTATIKNFYFRGWSLDMKLDRRKNSVHATVEGRRSSGSKASGPMTKDSLLVSVPGRVIELQPNKPVRFEVRYPETEGGRAENAWARAQLISHILLNQDLSPELQHASREELENRIRTAEDQFDRAK